MQPTSLLLLACVTIVAAVPRSNKNKRYARIEDGVTYTIFEHEASGATLAYVANSGICETTKGVKQYSGYLSVGTNMNMWFWFFESRNAPNTAPLAMWLNGGPGCSSMIGLFQENGPCQFYDGSATPSLNPHSFNKHANMLYVDQPIGVGFSYGTDDVVSTVAAAPYVWTLLQAFYASFPVYEARKFGLFTESYGGHYGPDFVHYFEEKNAAVAAGTVKGAEQIGLVALGINNGWYDPAVQYRSYVDFAYNNTYKRLVTEAEYVSLAGAYSTRCAPALAKCTAVTGADSACEDAEDACYEYVEEPVEEGGNFDVYDVRAPSDDPNPPETYVTYLRSSKVVSAIGAKTTYSECPDAPYRKFAATGDGARNFLDDLSAVVRSGIQVLLWAGDADWICNWLGGLEVANLVDFDGSAEFTGKNMSDYTVGGVSYGKYKRVANFSWLQVYEAGHEV